MLLSLALLFLPTMIGPDGDLAERGTQAVGLVLLVSSIASWAAMPKAYKLSSEGLLIETGAGGSRIPLDQIGTVRAIQPSEAPGLRLFGGSGLFGHWGTFRTKSGDTVSVRATRLYPAVRIERPNSRDLIVSPADVDGFVAAAEKLRA
ncbi:hypothetical protein GCM10007148_01120 [Parvularcula lutaonensis]|nr:hypothetical protein GCM10007148_01120 [Parvularcula lutaonensis]